MPLDDEAVVGRLDVGAEAAQAVDDRRRSGRSPSAAARRAPRTTVSPSAKQPSSATSGSSSIASGTSSASTTVPTSGPYATSSSVTGSLGGIAPAAAPRGRRRRPRPCAAAMRRKPVRVQFALMSSSTIREPRHEHRGGDVEGGRATGRRARAMRAELELVLRRRRVIRVAVARDPHAGRGRACARCGRGSARARSRSSCPEASSPASSTHDLTCAEATGSSYSIPRSGAAVHRERREAALARVDPRAHLRAAARDAVDRAAADRLVAVERPLAAVLPGEPARQQPHQRARRCRRRSCAVAGAAARRPAPRIASDAVARRSTSAPSACTAASVECVSAASR